MQKNLDTVILFFDFSKVYDLIHRGMMEQIQLANGLLKETITAIMMLDKNSNSFFGSPDGDISFFDIVAGVLQGDTMGNKKVLFFFIHGSCL